MTAIPSILEIARTETLARREAERKWREAERKLQIIQEAKRKALEAERKMLETECRIQEAKYKTQENERRIQEICAILQAADKSNPDPAIAKALKIAQGAN